MWNHAHLRWKAQNGKFHDKDSVYNAMKENPLVHIQAAYKHKDKLLIQDYLPFGRPLTKWPPQPESTMKLWLKRNIPYIQFCLKAAQKQAVANTPDIRKFMPGIPCTRSSPPAIKRRQKSK
eukprot:5445241-Ditylum_brightwellii.AAC.1